MKKIINKKLYNTDVAEKLHTWNNGYENDFGHCEEALYRTRRGAYFLAGSGGPKSRYALTQGNITSGGSDIEVLSEPEAIAWLEENGGTPALLKYFSGEILEG